MATPAPAVEVGRLEAAIRAVEVQYTAGAFKVGLAGLASPARLLAGPLLGLLPFLASAESRRAVQQLEALQPRIERWKTVLFQRAVTGKREDGSDYSRELFYLEGRDISKVIEDATGEAWEGTLFQSPPAAVESVAAGFGETVARVEEVGDQVGDFLSELPGKLPSGEDVNQALFWLKVAGGVVGVTALAVGVGYAVRAFR